MVDGVLEAVAVQLACQAVIPVFTKLFKAIRRLRKAHPEAKEFWSTFKRQYQLLRQTSENIVRLYGVGGTRSIWSKSIRRIDATAEHLLKNLLKKIQSVLRKEGHTWRIRWAIVQSDSKKASVKIGQLNAELLQVENILRL